MTDAEFCAAKAQHWRDTKMLRTRADALTGLTDPKLIEYEVPQQWENVSEADLRRLWLESKQEAGEGDAAVIESASVVSPTKLEGKSEEPPTSTKAEPLPAEETAKLEKDNMVADFMGKRRAELWKFQDFLSETHEILGKCSGCRYEDTIKSHCEEHKTKLTKAISILQRAVLENVPNKDKLQIF